MIADKELANGWTLFFAMSCWRWINQQPWFREESPSEAAAYATGVGAVFMCVYSELLDAIYADHPDIAPPMWSAEPELDGDSPPNKLILNGVLRNLERIQI